MKVLVCGSRTWTSVEQTKKAYKVLDEISPTWIISGGAAGADRIAELYARGKSIPVTILVPDWNKYGRSAGYKRNIQMLDMEPDCVVAFWDSQSRGTKHTIDEAKKRGIRTEVILP